MKFYTHKTTSIFVIDIKFHKSLLFRLRDVQFFQTAVTNLSYRYNLLIADVICTVTGVTSSVVTGVTSVRVDKQTTCYQKRIEF